MTDKTTTGMAQDEASAEKRWVALTSVLAAVMLTGGKLVVGLMTGSLGILSEAAHSALDLVAALVTLLAVRASGRPADRKHSYGHGKIENLSALFEVVLLLATCVWIIYEAVERLFFRPVEVEATWYAFAVIVVSIAIDVSRSRALMKAAKKHRSQALEADALHFSTDVWSSGVVLLGLAGVALVPVTGWQWLHQADAVAALGVALIVVWVSYRLARKTIDELLDAVPPELRETVESAVKVSGVVQVRQVRLRQAGPETFADVTLTVHGETSAEHAHHIANRAEDAVRGAIPGADVLVHVEPHWPLHAGVASLVRRVAAQLDLSVHGVQVRTLGEKHAVELHLEVPETWTVGEAHACSDRFEAELRSAAPSVDVINTHIEPVGEASATVDAAPADAERLHEEVGALAHELGFDEQPHALRVFRAEGRLSVSFHCIVDPDRNVGEAHAVTEEMERRLRERMSDLGVVTIHLEPERREGRARRQG